MIFVDILIKIYYLYGMKKMIGRKNHLICLFLMVMVNFVYSQNSSDEEGSKLIKFFKDKDNLGFVILISIGFVGFTFKLADVIIRARKEKKENNTPRVHHHPHHHHHHHHPVEHRRKKH
jgi:ABC-type nickel/cobalt efflux system permease component RcnA